MKLLSIRINDNLGYGIGNVSDVNLDEPPPLLKYWRISVRGPAVFLVSPCGWNPANATQPAVRKADGPVTVFEVPRTKCILRWEGVDSLEGAVKYDGPVMVPSDERRQIAEREREERELERATAPGKVAK